MCYWDGVDGVACQCFYIGYKRQCLYLFCCGLISFSWHLSDKQDPKTVRHINCNKRSKHMKMTLCNTIRINADRPYHTSYSRCLLHPMMCFILSATDWCSIHVFTSFQWVRYSLTDSARNCWRLRSVIVLVSCIFKEEESSIFELHRKLCLIWRAEEIRAQFHEPWSSLPRKCLFLSLILTLLLSPCPPDLETTSLITLLLFMWQNIHYLLLFYFSFAANSNWLLLLPFNNFAK